MLYFNNKMKVFHKSLNVAVTGPRDTEKMERIAGRGRIRDRKVSPIGKVLIYETPSRNIARRIKWILTFSLSL